MKQAPRLFTILIPSFEAVCGIFLLVGIFRMAASLLLVPLVLSFTFAILINLMQGNIFDCGCFGPLQFFTKISHGKIFFNIALIIGLLLIVIKERVTSDFLSHLKAIISYTFIIGLLIFIPYSNTSLAYALNMNNIKEIDWKTANDLIKENNAILFDARSNDQYKKEHIPGALSLPVSEFSRYFSSYNKMSKETLIVVYCEAHDCYSANMVGIKLIARGYHNIFKISGGFDAWNEKE
ncbi:MAG: rhodanese-like domain-containing protein [Acidobacteriota bacterium]|nr:rhodanese-like domain-containing protein [Acidobacteriota bacterium]